MLHSDNGWFIKLAYAAQRFIGVLDVVVGKLLAVELFSFKNRELLRNWILVQPSLLMTVFAVAHRILQTVGQRKLFWVFQIQALRQVL